ncbi:MAG: Pup--protein ligase [Actinomycetota bacterium]
MFLENGARLYLDVGSHPEYATGECDNARDAVIHDRAGERILEELTDSAEQRLRDEGIRGTIYLLKNNLDSAGNSYGCHENYSTERALEPESYEPHLIPFLATRQIFAGAGHVLQTARGPIFSIAQRSEHIWDSSSSATTRSRPIINTRDEPHADPDKFRRLHVIVGDSNMNEVATFLKLGTTHLVLRMIEDESFSLRDFTLENPIRAVRDISHDVTCTKKIRLASGRELSALDIQFEFLERTTKFLKTHDSTQEELLVLKRWESTLTQLAKDPLLLERTCDWVTKYRLVEGLRAKEALDLDDPKVLALDLQYHDISSRRGVFYKLQSRGVVERISSEVEVTAAMSVPPQTTRARLRGEFIRQAKARKRDYTVDWVHLKLNDQAQRTVLCKDPFQSEDDRVTKLIESL